MCLFISYKSMRSPVSCGCIVGADLRVRPVSGAQQAIGEPQAKGEPMSKGEHAGSPLRVCSFTVSGHQSVGMAGLKRLGIKEAD